MLIAPVPLRKSFVGAWIETRNTKGQKTSQRVAPFVGAWIETPNDNHYHPTEKDNFDKKAGSIASL